MTLLKSDLRSHYRAKMALQNPNGDSRAIEQQLEALLKTESGKWAAFAALADEPNINFENLETSVEWVYPRVEGDHIQFYIAPQHSLKPNKWGIREPNPAEHQPIHVNQLSGVCVPGLAFDPCGFRLGRGKGYYDRALNNFKGKKVGVAFSWQIADELPRESFDIPMDAVVTEKSIIRVSEVKK